MATLSLNPHEGLYLGIDFGTTNSVVSLYHQAIDLIETVPMEMGMVCPTAMAFEMGADNQLEKFYGIQAKEGALIHPESTVLNIKRYLASDDPISIVVGGKRYDFDSVHIAGEIMGYLKATAEAYVLETYGYMPVFEGVVITVPANSIDKQKQKTKSAAILAGFEADQVAIRLEPSAAAIGYASAVKARQQVLIYDFGGGTFDACVMAIEEKGGIAEMSPLATYGNNVLGGNDFDHLMMDLIYDHFLKETKAQYHLFDNQEDGISPREKRLAVARLTQVANAAKERLSTTDATQVIIAPWIQNPEIINLHMTVDVATFLNHRRRHPLDDPPEIFEQFKGRNGWDLIQDTLDCCDLCLNSAGIAKASIDEIFLVGGTSAMPAIYEKVKQHFNKIPYQNQVSPALGIARGAAQYAQIIAMQHQAKIRIKEQTTHSLGLQIAGRRYLEVIEKGLEIPQSGLTIPAKTLFKTNHDDLTSMVIVVYERLVPTEDVAYVYDLGMKRLAGTILKGIPMAKKGQVQVAITFHMDKNHLLKVEAKSVGADGVATSLTVDALYA